MTKVDVELAYRLIPVHPTDHPLLAIEWKGELYVNPMLPFGLHSAPKIFNTVADTLEWCLRQRGIGNVFHYLDDQLAECADAIAILDNVCATLGVQSWSTKEMARPHA